MRHSSLSPGTGRSFVAGTSWTRICRLRFDTEKNEQNETGLATSISRFNETRFLSFASKGRESEMHSKQIADNPKTIVVILDTGDEILSSLKSVAQTEHLASSSLKGDRRTERCRTWLVQLGGKEV
jgi:hypothetical protein